MRPMLPIPLIVCALALPLATCAAAESPPIKPLPPIKLKPIAFTEFDLPNGLHVILHENHAAPVRVVD